MTMIYKKPQEKIEADTRDVINLTQARGHVYVEGISNNRESRLVVYCPIHETTHVTTFSNYGRSKTGLPCCGNQQVSKKLIGRVYSEETLKRMSLGALKRPLRGGKKRRWRQTYFYAEWRRAVFKSCNNQCVVTGLKLKDTVKSVNRTQRKILVAHHFYSAAAYPNYVYVVENGIVLEESIHMFFHDTYGYRNNTLDQFLTFLKNPLLKQKLEKISMPISSQAKPEGLEGSETRANDPERVMKLHERLEKLAIYLKNIC